MLLSNLVREAIMNETAEETSERMGPAATQKLTWNI